MKCVQARSSPTSIINIDLKSPSKLKPVAGRNDDKAAIERMKKVTAAQKKAADKQQVAQQREDAKQQERKEKEAAKKWKAEAEGKGKGGQGAEAPAKKPRHGRAIKPPSKYAQVL